MHRKVGGGEPRLTGLEVDCPVVRGHKQGGGGGRRERGI
jgi:hypothetical protein